MHFVIHQMTTYCKIVAISTKMFVSTRPLLLRLLGGKLWYKGVIYGVFFKMIEMAKQLNGEHAVVEQCSWF